MAPEHTGPSSLRLSIRKAGPATVELAVYGDIDLTNVDYVRTTIAETVARRHPTSIALDLSGLEFIDTAGTRALAELCADLAAAGCTLTISHAQVHIRWMLSTFGLEGTFAAETASRRLSEPGS